MIGGQFELLKKAYLEFAGWLQGPTRAKRAAGRGKQRGEVRPYYSAERHPVYVTMWPPAYMTMPLLLGEGILFKQESSVMP